MKHPALDDAKLKMEKTSEKITDDLKKMRTGRPSPSLLEEIKVDYYGAATPISQVATVSIAEERSLVIKPWDKNLLSQIEKAIQKSDLGLNPVNDGSVIRLVFPSPTTEQKEKLLKKAKDTVEHGKIAIRNIRRDGVKDQQKNGEIPEDDAKTIEKELQDLTDKYVVKIDDIYQKKEKEIMEF